MSRDAAGYMLGTPSIQRYSFMSQPSRTVSDMSSENPTGAGNQQERPGIEQWVVGFVDGEGCFSISIVRNRTCRLGWQVQHEFSITQSASSRQALELAREVIGCGRIIENQRFDNHREAIMRLSVKGRADLVERILPFFEEHPLVTSKRLDFERFRAILHMMEDGSRHLDVEGLRSIASIAETMNRRLPSRYLESSEAIRRPTHPDG
jgi:hypothetical protein